MIVDYHYEAWPVLWNWLLFALMLFTFRPVYKARFVPATSPVSSRKETQLYVYFGLLVILYCTFGYADNDFYHYRPLYEDGLYSNAIHIMEDVYYWFIKVLPPNYYVWRCVVWGIATILMIATIKRLQIECRTSICVMALFYVMTLSIMRGNLGISILFYGFSFWVRPTRRVLVSYLFGLLLICASWFFHRSMFVSILPLLLTGFTIKRKVVWLSLMAFPFLVSYVTELLVWIIAGNADMLEEDVTSKMMGYAGAESAKLNMYGMMFRTLQYIPIVGSLIYITRKVVFQEYRLPKHIYPFFVYWYVMTYISFLFFFQETSNWLFIRFMMMSYLPMVIVLSYYYSQNRTNKWMRLFLLLQLIYCVYRLTYVFYHRLQLEGFI